MAVSSYTAKPGRAADRDETLRWLKADLAHAADNRIHRESLWTELWRLYLVQRRKAKDRSRANIVSPHGGMTIRDLVPQYKKMILSTDPFVRAQATKKEAKPLEQQVDLLAKYYAERAELEYKVLTIGLKEGLIFGFHSGIVDHVEESRQIRLDGPELEEARARGLVAGDDDMMWEVLESGPEITPVAIEDAFIDPAARDFYEQNIFFARSFKLLSQLKADPRYDADALGEIGKASSGSVYQVPLEDIFGINRRRLLGMPTAQSEEMVLGQQSKEDPVVEVMQAFTGGQLFTLANRQTLIREDVLDHPFPCYAIIPDPIPGEVYGKACLQDGITTLEQRDFLLNKIAESVKQSIDRVVVAVPGMVNRESLKKRHQGVIWAQDVNASIRELPQSALPAEAFGMATMLDREWDRSTGLGAPIQSIGGAGAVYNESATTTIRREENALAPVQEGVKQVERGLKRIFRIMFDIESKYWGEKNWIRLAGIDGSQWHQIDFDSITSDFDFFLVGSQYHLNKQAQVEAYNAVMDRALTTAQMQPGIIDLRELWIGALDAYGLPNRERIIPEKGLRISPQAEQQALSMGLPVKPRPDEDFQTHLQVHSQEMQRAQATSGDPRYLELLNEHIADTMRLVQEQQAALEQQAMSLQMQANGEDGNAPVQ